MNNLAPRKFRKLHINFVYDIMQQLRLNNIKGGSFSNNDVKIKKHKFKYKNDMYVLFRY
jgi:hypothetical protein